MAAQPLLWLQNEAVTYEWIKREYLSKLLAPQAPHPAIGVRRQVTGLAQTDRQFCGLFYQILTRSTDLCGFHALWEKITGCEEEALC